MEQANMSAVPFEWWKCLLSYWVSDGGLQRYRSAPVLGVLGPVLGRSEHRLFRCVRFHWGSLAFRHCCARGRAHSAEAIPPPSPTHYLLSESASGRTASVAINFLKQSKLSAGNRRQT